jgi:hypothetical protein
MVVVSSKELWWMYITVRTIWFLDFVQCLVQGCRNCFLQIAMWTEFCLAAHNICFSIWSMLHVTLLWPRISKWLLDFCRICAHLVWYWKILQHFRKWICSKQKELFSVILWLRPYSVGASLPFYLCSGTVQKPGNAKYTLVLLAIKMHVVKCM